MRRVRAIIGLLFALIAPAHAAKLFTIGDSQSAEVHAGWVAGQSWGAVVAANAGLTEVPKAVAGATTAQMQPQWDYVLANYATGDTVSAMAGANDINVTLIMTFRATLDGQIAAAIAAGIPASKITLHTPFILGTTDYLRAAPQYLQVIREIAYNRGVLLIDVYAHFAELAQNLGSITQFYVPGDTQHPSPAGHAEIARLYSLPQYAGSGAYHTLATPAVIGTPVLVTAPLHQTSGAGPTLLSDQVSYLDPSGAPPAHFNVQDYLPPGGEIGLQLDGADFPCSGSVTVTPAVFARLMLKPVAHAHDVWVSTTNGTYAGAGKDFALTPP